jgi:hypothetical protein
MMYHGASQQSAAAIAIGGLRAGSYTTTDFELAASYALRNDNPAVIVVDSADATPPSADEIVYDEEFILQSNAKITGVCLPQFAGKPADWWELNDDLSGRKYPELFNKNNWKAK